VHISTVVIIKKLCNIAIRLICLPFYSGS